MIIYYIIHTIVVLSHWLTNQLKDIDWFEWGAFLRYSNSTEAVSAAVWLYSLMLDGVVEDVFSHMTEFWITSFTKLCRYVYYVATNKTLSLQITRSILVSDHTDDRTESAPISFFIHKPTIGIGIWMDIGVMMMVVRHLYGSADWLCPSKTGWVAETERDGISRPANQLKCPKTYSAETALH